MKCRTSRDMTETSDVSDCVPSQSSRVPSPRRLATPILLAALLLPISLHAQITFERTYGGAEPNIGYSVQQTTDGGYIIAGMTYPGGTGPDVYLSKTDSLGNVLWSRTFGGSNFDDGRSVQQTIDGGYIIAGTTTSFGTGYAGAYLVKTDTRGDTQWTRTYDRVQDVYGYSVQQTPDGGYVIAGTIMDSARLYHAYLIRTDSFGDTVWTRTYGNSALDEGRSVLATIDSGFIIVGNTVSFGGGGCDAYAVRTDVHGDTLWTRTYGGAGDDVAYSVRQTDDGGFLIAGGTGSYGAGHADVYLVRTDGSGETLWTRTFGDTGIEYARSAQLTADGGFVVTGETRSMGAGLSDVYLVRTDSTGNPLWARVFGGSDDDEGYSVQKTLDGGFIVAGATRSFGSGNDDVYLIKTDSKGLVYNAVAEPRRPQAASPKLQAEPNPTTGRTTIRLSRSACRQSPLALRVYDASGCRVQSVFGLRASSFPLDLRALPSGAYFIRCDAGPDHATTRLVVQR
jgi:hypothetical protein